MTGKLLHFDCIFHFVWQHFAKSIQQYMCGKSRKHGILLYTNGKIKHFT